MAAITVAFASGNHAGLTIEKQILEPWDIEYVSDSCKTVEQTIALCRNADVILTTSAPMTAEVIRQLQRCKAIIRYGIGVDTIDLEAAAARQIPVVNIPDYGVNVVADHAVSLLLASVRKITRVVQHVKQGGWGFPGLGPIMDLNGKMLGLAGFGNIARQVARRMKAFDMQVIAYDPYVADDMFAQHGVAKASWEQVVRQSDVLSVHMPLNAQTKHWVNRESLMNMKRNAHLINTSRGGVVDTSALVEALREGWIAGAGLDVLEEEPAPKDHPLLPFPQCIITSHCASASVESGLRLHEYAGLEAARVLRGERPKHIVNGVEPVLTPFPQQVGR
ncbi:MAG: dehydrogenase [Paenibacillus sp.]|nr:dehydrogenase [Paenibacillus sp.]